MKVVIMRGISGSGKSTYAQQILDLWGPGRIVSADDFFMKDGTYQFNPSGIGEAHAVCLGKFLMHLQNRIPLVIADNTNIRLWEFNNYLKLARWFEYKIEILTTIKPSKDQIYLGHYRNVHNVPLEVIATQFANYEPHPEDKLLPPL